MFPLNWNIPFIRKNGSRTTLGAITGDIAGIEEDVAGLTTQATALWETIGQNGAKNLLPFDTFNNGSKTFSQNGVDATITENGIVFSGRSTGGVYPNSKDFTLKSGTYILSCEGFKNTGFGNFKLYKVSDSSNLAIIRSTDTNEYVEFTINSDIHVRTEFGLNSSGVDISGTAKPMIRLASDTDPTYQPYAMTNKELTDDLANMGLVRATPNKTTFNITYQDGKSGDMALVITSVGLGTLNYYASAWHWGALIIVSGTTITESNNSANGLTLTSSGNIGLFILPLNTEGDKWAITTN